MIQLSSKEYNIICQGLCSFLECCNVTSESSLAPIDKQTITDLIHKFSVESLPDASSFCVVSWHPYPKSKPSRGGMYLVQRDNISMVATWDGNSFWTHSLAWELTDVTSWSEIPCGSD